MCRTGSYLDPVMRGRFRLRKMLYGSHQPHVSWKRKSVRKPQHHEGLRCVATTQPMEVAPFKSAIFPKSSEKLLRRGDYDLVKVRYRYDCLRVSTHIPVFVPEAGAFSYDPRFDSTLCAKAAAHWDFLRTYRLMTVFGQRDSGRSLAGLGTQVILLRVGTHW